MFVFCVAISLLLGFKNGGFVFSEAVALNLSSDAVDCSIGGMQYVDGTFLD